jgi:hypothetical protein
MKTYADWCKEYGWAETNSGREQTEAMQADAIEAGVEAIRSVARLCGWAHGSAYRAVDALRALKPSPPVVHKKCPGCGANGLVTSDENYSETNPQIACPNACFRTAGVHTSTAQAWRIWDARVGAKE